MNLRLRPELCSTDSVALAETQCKLITGGYVLLADYWGLQYVPPIDPVHLYMHMYVYMGFNNVCYEA